MSKKIIVIGGSAAGPKAASRARRLDQEAEIQEIRDTNTVSLLEEQRKKENDVREQRRLDRLNGLRSYRGLEPLVDLESDEEEDVIVAEEDEDEEGIAKIMLEEAARVLADFIEQKRPVTAQAG